MPHLLRLVLPLLCCLPMAAHATQIGTTDRILLESDREYGEVRDKAAVTSDGVLFAMGQTMSSGTGSVVHIYRSVDGVAWTEWGTLDEPASSTGSHGYTGYGIVVAEGVQDRLYVLTRYVPPGSNDEIRVAWSDLAAPSAVWSTSTLYTELDPTTYVVPVRMATDAFFYPDYRLHVLLAARTNPAPGDLVWDLWFSTSADQGQTWNAPYALTSGTADQSYQSGDLACGSGGIPHVTYVHLDRTLLPGPSTAILTRRALGFAASGITDWQPPIQLAGVGAAGTTTARIAAHPQTSDVMVVVPDLTGDSAVRWSDNQGATWVSGQSYDAGAGTHRIAPVPATSSFVLTSQRPDGQTVLRRSNPGVPLQYGPDETFQDDLDPPVVGGVEVFSDPSRSNQLFAAWNTDAVTGQLRFDAEWLDAPGIPNAVLGFPAGFPGNPNSHPLVGEVDGAGGPEILFTTKDTLARGLLVGIHADGSLVWPGGVLLGTGVPSEGYPPLALADVDRDGVDDILMSRPSGAVSALPGSETGPGPLELVQHWALPGATSAPYVAVGVVSRTELDEIVAVGADRAFLLRKDGSIRFTFDPLPFPPVAPFALADFDADGRDTILVPTVRGIYRYDYPTPAPQLVAAIDGISDAPTVGDLDLDGHLDIVVPTSDDLLHVIAEDGLALPGWPYFFDRGPLTSAALVDTRGDAGLELVVASEATYLHHRTAANLAVPGWPLNVGVELPAMPIVDGFFGGNPWILAGDQGAEARMFDTAAAPATWFPLSLPGPVPVAPASGDLDLDGEIELVLVTQDHVVAYDLQSSLNGLPRRSRWPMYGNGTRRTQCQECPFDPVTAVEPPARTRLSFAAPHPNPAVGPVTLSFRLAEAGPVHLAIYDLRGRQVRVLHEGRVARGQHTLRWSGRDGRDRPVARGNYLARLRAGDQEQTRAIQILR